MHITRFSGRLRWCRNLRVSGAPLNRVAVGRVYSVITFVGRQQGGPRTNLNLLESAWLFNFSRWITLGGGIHNIDPNRQRELAPERTAINLLRLVKACPDGASEIGIVSGKQRVSEIVSGAGFTRCGHFFEPKVCKSSFARSGLKCVH